MFVMEYRFRLLLACLISPLMTIPSVAHPSVAHPSVAQTRDEVLSAIAAQSPQSALASAPTSPPPTTSSPTLPDWMWWLILSTIPLAVLGAILYGFQRVNQQTNSQTNLQINSQANQRTTHRKTTHQKTESAKHQGRSAQRSSFLRGKSAFAAAKGAKTNRNQSKRADNTTLDTPLNDTTGLEQKSDPLEPSLGQPLELAEHSNQQSISEESIHEGFIHKESIHKESIHELGDLTVSETTRLSRVDIVDELIQDLQSVDASRRRKAIWELGQRGDSRAVQPLVDLLMDSDSQQRSLILAAVSEIGIRTLKPMNRALFMSVQDDSAEVRKNAIRDVTRVFDLVTQMSQLLQYATSDEDREVQETAEWALEQLNRIRPLPGTEGLPRLGDRDLPSIDASADPRLPFPPELD
jgi:hypothetical protein